MAGEVILNKLQKHKFDDLDTQIRVSELWQIADFETGQLKHHWDFFYGRDLSLELWCDSFG